MTTTPEEGTPFGSPEGGEGEESPPIQEVIRSCFEPMVARGFNKAVGFLDQVKLTLVGAAISPADDDTLERAVWEGLFARRGQIGNQTWDGMFAIYSSDVRDSETKKPVGIGYIIDMKLLRPMIGLDWESIRLFYFDGDWTHTDMTEVEGFAAWATSPQ